MVTEYHFKRLSRHSLFSRAQPCKRLGLMRAYCRYVLLPHLISYCGCRRFRRTRSMEIAFFSLRVHQSYNARFENSWRRFDCRLSRSMWTSFRSPLGNIYLTLSRSKFCLTWWFRLHCRNSIEKCLNCLRSQSRQLLSSFVKSRLLGAIPVSGECPWPELSQDSKFFCIAVACRLVKNVVGQSSSNWHYLGSLCTPSTVFLVPGFSFPAFCAQMFISLTLSMQGSVSALQLNIWHSSQSSA